MAMSHFVRIQGTKLAAIAAIAIAQGIIAAAAIAQSADLNSFGPSIAGRTYAFALDPENPDVIYQGGDVNGVYLSEDFGGHWRLWNEGLENGDLTSSFYVDDLLVVTQDAEFPVDANRVGVYAATLGGIYFRPRNGGAWTLLTDYRDPLHGAQYHYDRADQGSRRGFPVPYCTLVYDRVSRTIYAGAGNGRYEGADLDLYRNNYTYPGLTSQFTVLDGVDQQYVVWSLDVGTTGSHWQPLPLQAGGPTGIARQLAIVQADIGRYLAVGTSDGVYTRDLELGQSGQWSRVADYASKAILDAVWSGFVWGIAAGSEGRLYALTRGTENASGVTKAAGVFYLDLGTTSDGNWHGLDSGLIAPPHAVTFKNLLSTASPDSLDLCTLTVRPGSTSDEDEIFVGAAKTYYGGYFRYGKYYRPAPGGSEEVTGWMQFIYCDDNLWNIFDYRAIDWHSNPYQTKLLYDDASSSNEMGWLTNNSLNAFVPMVFDGGSRMLLDVYHTPMKSVDAGSSWTQTYCTAAGSGWSGNGMNLDTTNGIAFDSNGRMYMSANDFGAFEELHAGSHDFQWTTWHSTYHWSFGALAVMSGITGDEVFGAHTPHDGTWNLMRRNRNAQPHSASTWEKQGQAVGGAKIEQIAVYDVNRLLLAKSFGNGPGLFVSERQVGGDFGDAAAIPGTSGEKFFGVARIPGTQLVVAIGDGRLICFDMETPSSSMRVWLSSSNTDPIIRNAIKGASTLYVDRLGRVIYVGTKGDNRPSAVGANDAIGTVLRIRGPFATSDVPSASSVTVLANSGAGDHPFGFAEALFGCTGHEGDENARYTHVRAIATDINNPNRVYVGLGVPSFDYQGNMHPKNGVWLYDETNIIAGSPWRQVFGASSTQERGANRPVTVLTTGLAGPQLGGAPLDTLYIGTDGQGPFWIPVDVSSPPSIAAAASEPIWSTGHATPTTIAVSITHPSNLEMSTVELYADALGVAGPIAMYDGGPQVSPGTDLVAGDHIYTSPGFSSNVAAGTYQVRVFAQATDGSYDQEMVTVEAVPYTAKLTNVSNEPLGINYSGTPYSAIALDFDGGEKDLLLTQEDAGRTIRFQGLPPTAAGAPQYLIQKAHDAFGWRGATGADFDNDGLTDYFVAGAGSMLWRNEESTGATGDVTAALGLVGVDNATAACWGDYDRDGWLDLFVVRNVDSGVSPGVIGLIGEHRLFRNCIGEGGGFVDATATAGLNAVTLPASISASWIDVDQNGYLDLFVAMAPVEYESGPLSASYSQLFPTPSRLFMNQGDGTFVDGFDARFAEQLSDIMASVWADVNGDLSPDLLLATGANGARGYVNDGTGHFSGPIVPLRNNSMGYSGLAVADQDLDGWLDVLLAPLADGSSVQLLLNKDQSGNRKFADATVAAGLGGQAAVSGLLAADFTGDGDVELFAGMPFAVKSFFYKSDAQDGSARLDARYVKVRLASPYGANCRDGMGARVVVMETTGGAIGFSQMQIVDGGSGRGSQRDRDLLFGLGDYEGEVTASVFWPNGHVQTNVVLQVSDVSMGETLNVITDNSMPTISNVSAASVADLSNNTLTWTFTWNTSVASFWQTDEIQFLAGTGTSCPPGGASIMATDGGVTHTYAAMGNGVFRHSLTIANVECVGDCSFRYRVRSGDGPYKQYSPWYVKKVSFCPAQI